MKKHLHLDEHTWEALESCLSGVCDVDRSGDGAAFRRNGGQS